jgi:hypothetical protein
MGMCEISYEEARPMMKTGDLLAFGGCGLVSELLRLATRSEVSHVGVAIRSQVLEEDRRVAFDLVVEAALVDGAHHVAVSRMAERLEGDEQVWWLPLRRDIRELRFDSSAFCEFLLSQARERSSSAVSPALRRALEELDRPAGGGEREGPRLRGGGGDLSRSFCSELVAAALEVAGAVGPVDASQVTPIDLCRWSIYEPTYFLLKGSPSRRIRRYNTLDPKLWI